MDTKKGIEFCKFIENLDTYSEENAYIVANGIPCVIEILQRGEKYETIYEDLKNKYGTFFRDTEEGRCLGEMMAKMEYEYSPKPAKKEYIKAIDFADGESITIKYTAEKTKNGKIIIIHCEETLNERGKI